MRFPVVARRHRVVRPEIAAANARTCHPNQGISRLDDPGVGNGLDAHIVRAIHHSRSHVIPSILGRMTVIGRDLFVGRRAAIAVAALSADHLLQVLGIARALDLDL